ncbi:MAG: DUF4097 domain-containing protein [Micrococcales bacterium]|nr:DUF4097 domain-containing protein [Micrococcales bacterium]MCL2667072.1 DUF4097 domain-containing protein [Micrococcales bacterium]
MATESWVVAGPQVIEVDEVSAVRVQIIGGRVDVVGQDGPGARLEVHDVHGRPLEISLRDGELRVGYSDTLSGWEAFLDRLRTFRSSDKVDVHLAVPRAAAVRVGTVSAEGLVADIDEDSSVGTVSGSLVVDSTRGQLSARSVSGEIAVRSHYGPLTMNSVSGDLAASGGLTAVHANTISGAVSLDLASATSSITTTSVSGDVTARLPEEVGVQVRVQAATGRVVIDGVDHKGSMPGAANVDEPGDAGTCHLLVTTVSGDVTVLRGAAVSDAPEPAADPRDDAPTTFVPPVEDAAAADESAECPCDDAEPAADQAEAPRCCCGHGADETNKASDAPQNDEGE